MYKCDKEENFARELVKMVQDGNEEIMRSQVVLLNFRVGRCELADEDIEDEDEDGDSGKRECSICSNKLNELS